MIFLGPGEMLQHSLRRYRTHVARKGQAGSSIRQILPASREGISPTLQRRTQHQLPPSMADHRLSNARIALVDLATVQAYYCNETVPGTNINEVNRMIWRSGLSRRLILYRREAVRNLQEALVNHTVYTGPRVHREAEEALRQLVERDQDPEGCDTILLSPELSFRILELWHEVYQLAGNPERIRLARGSMGTRSH
jgi:hypothetical protein